MWYNSDEMLKPTMNLYMYNRYGDNKHIHTRCITIINNNNNNNKKNKNQQTHAIKLWSWCNMSCNFPDGYGLSLCLQSMILSGYTIDTYTVCRVVNGSIGCPDVSRLSSFNCIESLSNTIKSQCNLMRCRNGRATTIKALFVNISFGFVVVFFFREMTK